MRFDYQPYTLSDFKLLKKSEVNEIVEGIRGRFITLGSGQSMVYQEKEREAIAYFEDNNNVGPHIQAEVGITGQTAFEVATVILFMAGYWRDVSSRLEAARLSIKSRIDDATSHQEVINAMNVDWEAVINGEG